MKMKKQKMSYKKYKIRDGVHIPSDKFRKNWDAIFGKKTAKTEFKPEGENSEKPLILNKKQSVD